MDRNPSSGSNHELWSCKHPLFIIIISLEALKKLQIANIPTWAYSWLIHAFKERFFSVEDEEIYINNI